MSLIEKAAAKLASRSAQDKKPEPESEDLGQADVDPFVAAAAGRPDAEADASGPASEQHIPVVSDRVLPAPDEPGLGVDPTAVDLNESRVNESQAKVADAVSGSPGAARRFDVWKPEPRPGVDLSSLGPRGYLTPSSGRGQLAQEMRRIKRPLVLNAQKQRSTGATDKPPANIIMVTSAVPEEGKSFIAINLAVSLAAEVDRRVLLVDADVAMRDITRDFDLEGKPGVAELLAESGSRYEDYVLTTSVPGLSILPAGAPVDHVDELFASRRMEALIKLLAEEDPERIVLFDTSPLLRTTESTVLARRMGQVVLVVEANKTSQSAVTKAVGLLEGCANVSLLLNKASRTESSDYGYGYSYGADLETKT